MITAPPIKLPAPWGHGVVQGFVSVLPMPDPTDYRGRLAVYQFNQADGRYLDRLRCLFRAGQKQDRRLFDAQSRPSRYPFEGLVGWVDVVDCHDLHSPGCRLGWDDHYNGGAATLVCRWAWILDRPEVASDGQELSSRGHMPAQQVLGLGARP